MKIGVHREKLLVNVLFCNKMACAQSDPNKTSFEFEEVQGDLFSCPVTWSMAHCISEDCRMGKGIAVMFKKKFGGIDELLRQRKKTGDVAILKRGNRFIYYLITKEKAFHKPTYNSLKLSLQAMREHCRTHRVQHLAMPKIGCGLDQLQWKEVSQIIKDTFTDTDIKIMVYYI